MPTTVVNIRHEKCDIKIGRNPKGQVPDPPAPGCFGNPYSVKQFGLDQCLLMYLEYFEDRIKLDTVFLAEIQKLKGMKLGCFCRPPEGFQGQLLCHGQIIAGYLEDVDPTKIS
jgi:hypothetical protein